MIGDLRYVERVFRDQDNDDTRSVRILQMRRYEFIGNERYPGDWEDVPVVKERV